MIIAVTAFKLPSCALPVGCLPLPPPPPQRGGEPRPASRGGGRALVSRSVVVFCRAFVLVRAFVRVRSPRAAAHPDYPLAPCVLACRLGRPSVGSVGGALLCCSYGVGFSGGLGVAVFFRVPFAPGAFILLSVFVLPSLLVLLRG